MSELTTQQKIDDIREFFNQPGFIVDTRLIDIIYTSVIAMQEQNNDLKTI